ncbi:MAG: hypothetical protein PW788_09260 [Micavibrio sp.]|nr:hypothetical protein [Micavibrio sp.]
MKNILAAFCFMMISACTPGPVNNADIVLKTAPGYPILYSDGGVYFNPCKEGNSIGLCTRWIKQSDLCVNPKGPYANPPLLKCPKDKNGNPIPFK